MNKKLFSVIALLVIVALPLASCRPKATPTAVAPVIEDEWGIIRYTPGTKVKIGVSSALAGGYAVYGQDMLNGVTLAIEDFGGALKGWEVIAEGGDDACEGAPGVTVAERFCADPIILGVVGPMCSGSVVPASDIYDKHRVVMVTPSSTAVIVTSRGFQNIFRVVANDDLQAKVTVEHLFTDLGLRSLAALHDQSIYGQGIAEAVKDKFEAAGGTATDIQGITRGDIDFSAVISTILKSNPEAIYFGGMDAEGALIVNQLRAAGFQGVFMGPDGIKSKPTYIDASGGAAEGSYASFGAVGGAGGYEDWEARFTEKFGAPVAYGPGSYDAAMIILKAADAVAQIDAEGNLVIGRKALADMIRATPHQGITGYLEFTDTGDLGKVSITVFKVENGEFVEVKKVDFGD